MWILRAAVCLTVPVLIAGQCSKDTPKPAPLSPAGDDVAVAVWSEVAGFRETYVVREVYDKSTDRAFLEYYDKGAFQKLLFDRKKKLFYSYTDDNCTFLQGDKIANFYRNTPLFKALDMKKVPEKGFLGPASIFDDFSASKDEIEKLAECDPDRLVSCTEYRTCDSHPALYRYSADGTEIFGQSKGRPLRYRREWSFNSRIAVEVLSIKSYTKSQDLFIPTGLSCENPNDEVVAIPFDTGRRSFVGEVVMTTDLSDKVFVSKLDALIIPSSEKKTEDGKMSGIYSFTKTSFRTNADGDLVPDAEEQIIHDVEHRVVFRRYTRDDKDDIAIHETKCHILSAEDFNLELEFPAYGSIRLEPIFLGGPVDATWSPIDYSMKSHLGANKIGDTETDVYEMTYPAVETGNGVRLNRLVVSHHFSATSIFAVEINAFNQSNFKIFSATIYISQYENKITQLNEKLRVDDCPDYQDSSESRWLEIGFVYPNSEVVAQVEESAPQIKDAFINKLQSEFGVDPMRLPQINVDFVEQQVLVNALLLERPLIGMAYKDPQEKEFKKPTRVLGIMSSSACQITCLGMGENECTAISYCGATCSISDAPNPAAPALTVNSDECWLSERNFDRDIAVSSRILRELRAKVTTPATVDQLRLKIITADGDASSDGSQEVELLAITYDDTKNFDSAFHFDKEKTAILDSSFKIAMAKRRYKTESRGSLIGSFQLEDCALACKNRPTCEALSYCMNSMECVISGDHEIDADEVQEDSACIVYQKRYLDRFERFPGLSVLASKDTVKAADEESCAQKCVQRPDCKSFEFCDSTGDCLLLTTHISDAKVESNDQNAEQAKCSHYSKRFLFDYAVVPKMRGNGDETTELAEYANITQAACAKLCSEWGDKDKACFSFDFCGPATDNTGVCTLRTVDGESQSESPTCNFLYLTIPPGQAIVQHGSGEAIGLSILMMVIGAGLAVGGLFLYTKYA